MRRCRLQGEANLTWLHADLLQAHAARDQVYAALREGTRSGRRGSVEGDLVTAVDAAGGKTCPDQALRLDGAMWSRAVAKRVWGGGAADPWHACARAGEQWWSVWLPCTTCSSWTCASCSRSGQ